MKPQEVSGRSPGHDVVVVGFGRMGAALAGVLRSVGRRVLAVDPDASRLSLATQSGCEAIDDWGDPRLEPATVVITCLPSDEALDAVVAGLSSVRWSAPPIVIETSTLSAGAKTRAREALGDAGLASIDAPISGTSIDVSSRNIAIFASGDTTDLRRAAPVLADLADRVIELGEFGVGTLVKLLANHLVLVHTVAAAEVVALARAASLDPATVLDAVGAGAGASRMLECRGRPMVERRYVDGCSIEMLCKDAALIEALIENVAGTAPLFSRAARIFRLADRGGLSSMDGAAVHELFLSNERCTLT